MSTPKDAPVTLPPSAEALLQRLNRMAARTIAENPGLPWGGTPEQWAAWYRQRDEAQVRAKQEAKDRCKGQEISDD